MRTATKPPRTTYLKGWSLQTHYLYAANKRGKLLVVTLVEKRPGMWVAIAIEAPKGMDESLEGHAHHIIGRYIGMLEAMEASEVFAARWKKHRGPVEECACDDIKGVSK